MVGEPTLQKLPAVWYPDEHLVSLGYKGCVYGMCNNILVCLIPSLRRTRKDVERKKLRETKKMWEKEDK